MQHKGIYLQDLRNALECALLCVLSHRHPSQYGASPTHTRICCTYRSGTRRANQSPMRRPLRAATRASLRTSSTTVLGECPSLEPRCLFATFANAHVSPVHHCMRVITYHVHITISSHALSPLPVLQQQDPAQVDWNGHRPHPCCTTELPLPPLISSPHWRAHV